MLFNLPLPLLCRLLCPSPAVPITLPLPLLCQLLCPSPCCSDCCAPPTAVLFNLPLPLSQVYSGVVTLLDEAVLPSLSLLHCNCSLAEEVWSVLRMLPYDVR